MPAAAMTRQTTLHTGEEVLTESRKPTAASTRDPAICNLRSPVRSDEIPMITINTAAARYGIIDTTPTRKLLNPVILDSMRGIHKAMPYMATISVK